MKAYSKEFYEAIEFFERCVTKSEYGNYRFDKPTREARERLPSGEWYNHGETNRAFHLFIHGIEYGKKIAAQDNAEGDLQQTTNKQRSK